MLDKQKEKYKKKEEKKSSVAENLLYLNHSI